MISGIGLAGLCALIFPIAWIIVRISTVNMTIVENVNRFGVSAANGKSTETKNQDANRRPRGRPKTASDGERRSNPYRCATFHEFGYGGTTMDLVAHAANFQTDPLSSVYKQNRTFHGDNRRPPHHNAALPHTEEHMPLATRKNFRGDIDEAASETARRSFTLSCMGPRHFPETAAFAHTRRRTLAPHACADWLKQQVGVVNCLDDPLAAHVC